MLRALLSISLALGLATSVTAQNDGVDLLMQAIDLSTAQSGLSDWGDATRPVITELATRGDIDGALAIIAGAPDPSVIGTAQIAVVDGLIDRPDLAMAERLALGLSDPGTRTLALVQVIEAHAKGGAAAAAESLFASLDLADRYRHFAVDDIIRIRLQAGDRAGADALVRSLDDPTQRADALLWIAYHLIDNDDLDSALAVLAAQPAAPSKDLLQAVLVGALGQADRGPEARALVAGLSDPMMQARGHAGLFVAAGLRGDIATLPVLLAAIANDIEQRSALFNLAAALARDGQSGAALDLLPLATDTAVRTAIMGAIKGGLIEQGQYDAAAALLDRLEDPLDTDSARLVLVEGWTKAGDFDRSRTMLATVARPNLRRAALIGLIAAGADTDGGLLSQALALVPPADQPVDRVRALVNLARALRQAADL